MHALIFSGYDRVGFTDHLSEDPHPLPLVIIAESAPSENNVIQFLCTIYSCIQVHVVTQSNFSRCLVPNNVIDNLKKVLKS